SRLRYSTSCARPWISPVDRTRRWTTGCTGACTSAAASCAAFRSTTGAGWFPESPAIASGHAQPPGRPVPRIDQPVAKQPGARIPGILLEPGPRRSQPEAVPPGIHVGPHATAPAAGQLAGENDLQVT